MGKRETLKIVGPVLGGKDAEAVAYIIAGRSQGRQHTVCMVTLNTSPMRTRLIQNVQTFFDMTLDMAKQKLVAWAEIPCFVLVLQPRSQDQVRAHVTAYRTREKKPRKLAKEVLSSIYLVSSQETNTATFQLAKELVPLESNFSSYLLTTDQEQTSLPTLVKDEGTLNDFLNDFSHLQPALQLMEKHLYLEEVPNFLNTNQPVLAFRSFSYYSLLIDPSNSEELEILLQLGNGLIANFMQQRLYDYAEWVACSVATHAERASRLKDAVEGWRLAAIACEALGRIEETKTHYEQALVYCNQLSNTRTIARLHMSYGISLLILLAHTEAELTPDMLQQASWKNLLDSARSQLLIAQHLYSSFNDEQAWWSRCAIALDLIRLDDVNGQHEQALDALNTLVTSEQFILEPKLIATALLYRSFICKKLADENDSWLGAYYASLNEAREVFQQPSAFEDKCIIFYTLLGEALLKNSQKEGAVQALETAYKLQHQYTQSTIRPPQPDALYGGLQAIDICGKLQHALHQLAEAEPQASNRPSSYLQALLVADHAKGQFFQRDLAFLTFTPEQRLSPFLSLRESYLRHAIVRGEIDHRIMMADYERFLTQDVPSESAKQFLSDIRQDIPSTQENIQALWASVEGSVVLVSLYAAANQTYVYVLKSEKEEPHLFQIDISLQQLQKVVTDLQWGISGHGLRPHIDPQHPERNQSFFASLLRLAEHFSPLLPLLQDVNVILLSPHGLWHNLPLHLFLLPPLWKSGHNPGLVYLPSIRLFHLLRQRDAAQELFHYKTIGLTTAYEYANTRDLFEQAHQDFVKTFEQSGASVLASLGEQATETRLFSQMQQVGLYHLLAHGWYERDNDPMHSSILLSDTNGIPFVEQPQGKVMRGAVVSASALMANGTTARHMTIQACSLGRSRSSYGDEFWGMSRALIAAGASSVLAPLWDIHPASSTRLLQLFYERWLINKQSKWRAWADAQYTFYTSQEQQTWQHFYHWAAFRLIGY